MKRFKIRSEKYKQWFWVYVYDDIEQLRKEADKFDKKIGHAAPFNNEDILGICHSYEREVISDKGEIERVHENVGLIRLADKYCSSEVVSHEVIHAAMQLYRVMQGTENEYEGSDHNADFGNGCRREEEDFAYIYGELFHDMTRQLYKYKVWN